MKKKKKFSQAGAKHGNDPSKNDPTKQDERDNDATRIQPEKEITKQPKTEPGGKSYKVGDKKNAGKNENTPPYERTPSSMPRPVKEPDKRKERKIWEDYNPAAPKNKQNDVVETDDEGSPIMKSRFGKGL